MTAPDHTLEPFKNVLHQRGHPYMCKCRVGSSHESSVVAGVYEQAPHYTTLVILVLEEIGERDSDKGSNLGADARSIFDAD